MGTNYTAQDGLAREAAVAVDRVLDQMPAPGVRPNQADVLVARAAMYAAEQAGQGHLVQGLLRPRG